MCGPAPGAVRRPLATGRGIKRSAPCLLVIPSSPKNRVKTVGLLEPSASEATRDRREPVSSRHAGRVQRIAPRKNQFTSSTGTGASPSHQPAVCPRTTSWEGRLTLAFPLNKPELGPRLTHRPASIDDERGA